MIYVITKKMTKKKKYIRQIIYVLFIDFMF